MDLMSKQILKNLPSRVELPFYYEPPVAMYQGCAFPLGIIMAQAEAQGKDITPWLCGKYINWMYVPNLYNMFNHYFDDSWMRNDGILKLQRIHIRKETYASMFGELNLIDLFRGMLARGLYPSDYYNEQKIPGKEMYQRRVFKHDFVLTGYDDSQECFISGGYLADGHFHKFTIPYDIMQEAYFDVCGSFITCNFWKYNDNAVFSLNIAEIVRYLSDYVYSTTSVDLCSRGRLFGLEGMLRLGDKLVQSAQEKEWLDSRFTRGFLEHKMMMDMRIRYLTEIGILEDHSFGEFADEAYRKSQLVHNLGLKYKITGKMSIITRMQSTIADITALESEYLPKVLENLRQKEALS